MADDDEQSAGRITVRDVAMHPILREFREDTKERLKELERAVAEFSRTREERDWRIKQQHEEISKRLDKIDARVEPLSRLHEERDWRIRNQEERIASLEKKPAVASLLGDSTFVKAIVLALLSAVVALAGGQLIGFP